MVPSTAAGRWMGVAAWAALGVSGAATADGFADLVAAERAFAADASTRNVRDAFLAATAPDGVMFSPDPVRAIAYWSAREVTDAKLEWAPAGAEIAASGDLGYTYGPWRYTPAGADKPAGYGHFFTIWQKQADGTWRFLADKGVSHAEVPLPTEVVRRGQIGMTAHANGGPAPKVLAELREADLLPVGEVLPALVAPDFIRFRAGKLPGPASESPALVPRSSTSFASWAVLSAAGDLAATWGGSEGGGSWVRVWRRAGVGDPPGQPWRLVADVSDVSTPTPPETEK